MRKDRGRREGREYNQDMKVRLPLTCLLVAGTLACAHPRPTGSESPAPPAPPAPSPIAAHRVDFATQIQPILETHCQPCHFEGGQMYERLPFDRGETIVGLGEKLFTRIKDEGEREVIRGFLAQEASTPSR
jgi:hypothetical protein